MTADVPDSVGYSLRCDHKIAGFHRQFPPLVEQQDPLSLDHLVHLVHALVGMKGMKLPRLKGIQSYKEPGRFEQAALAHLVGTPFRMVGRPEDRRMFHVSPF